jgi:enoyl-CoA hydratase/carnithine racemase
VTGPPHATVEVTVDGPVGRLTLDRPDKLNPLGPVTLREITAAAGWFDRQPDVKVVVVSGKGRAFSAGADVGAFTGDPAEGDPSPREAADAGRIMADAVEAMRAVTVASLHGHCIGGGVVLMVACDLRVAAADTNFAIPEVDLGIPRAWGGIPRLVREIGPAATRDLVLTCRPFTADEAQQLGLVNRVVAPGDLSAAVEELVGVLAAKSAVTLEATTRHVDAVSRALADPAQSWSDADALLSALHDPESREVAARYLAGLGRGEPE